MRTLMVGQSLGLTMVGTNTPDRQQVGWRSGDCLYSSQDKPLGWFDRGNWSNENLTLWSTSGEPLYNMG
jgi:hypothetical protein